MQDPVYLGTERARVLVKVFVSTGSEQLVHWLVGSSGKSAGCECGQKINQEAGTALAAVATLFDCFIAMTSTVSKGMGVLVNAKRASECVALPLA